MQTQSIGLIGKTQVAWQQTDVHLVYDKPGFCNHFSSAEQVGFGQLVPEGTVLALVEAPAAVFHAQVRGPVKQTKDAVAFPRKFLLVIHAKVGSSRTQGRTRTCLLPSAPEASMGHPGRDSLGAGGVSCHHISPILPQDRGRGHHCAGDSRSQDRTTGMLSVVCLLRSLRQAHSHSAVQRKT